MRQYKSVHDLLPAANYKTVPKPMQDHIPQSQFFLDKLHVFPKKLSKAESQPQKDAIAIDHAIAKAIRQSTILDISESFLDQFYTVLEIAIH